jgi:hypothetical protein
MKKREEKAEVGAYGGLCYSVIIEIGDSEKILIRQGFGGVDTPHGGAYRWRHGVAVALRPDDTFQSLSGDWNEALPHISAILSGYDPERPVLEWSGRKLSMIIRRLKNGE